MTHPGWCNYCRTFPPVSGHGGPLQDEGAGMNITEFLLDRIAEDEQIANRAAISVNTMDYENRGESAGYEWSSSHGMIHADGRDLWDNEGSGALCMHEDVAVHAAIHDPSRVLSECTAKRAIIGAHKSQEDDDDEMAWIVASEVLLEALAAVYADHDDYRAEWIREQR